MGTNCINHIGGKKMNSVGIDASKGKSTVAVIRPGGEVSMPPFEVNHTIVNWAL